MKLKLYLNTMYRGRPVCAEPTCPEHGEAHKTWWLVFQPKSDALNEIEPKAELQQTLPQFRTADCS